MESIITKFFFSNWQRKLIALLVAVIVWVFVNQSITTTKTISNIPVRVVNIPEDKTIRGLLPNGYLEHRLTLALTGTKDTVDKLEQGDLEVKLDATMADSDDWIVQVTKKNLVSLEPSVDLSQHINSVSHSEFVIKLDNLVTDKIPILITHPIGHAPKGYEVLDVWPQRLLQTVSGPEEEIKQLKIKGLKLAFDLNKISSEELDALKNVDSKEHSDEVSFMIPKKWKKIAIPFLKYAQEDINDPDADHMRIDFLRKQLLSIKKEIQVQVFFPEKYSNNLNPQTYAFLNNEDIHLKNGLAYYTKPIYAQDVSRLFLDVVQDNLTIILIASPKGEQEALAWNLELIDPQSLENAYVEHHINEAKLNKSTINLQQWEEVLRHRFREYSRRMYLADEAGHRLNLHGVLQDHKIIITTPE